MSTTNTRVETVTEETPPSPVGTLMAMINDDHMTLKVATAELIVNSIEHARARRIDLSYNAEWGFFKIVDDGKGCDDMRALSKLGKHYHSGSRQNMLSRYGVGLKDAAVWLGDTLKADSLHGESGQKLSMRADWDEMIETDRWLYKYSAGSKRSRPGMTLEICDLRPSRFHAWKKMPQYIAENFSAAINKGIVITVDGVPVEAKPDPKLDERVEFSGTWTVNGVDLSVQGFCGILKDTKNYESGWEVQYGPMVITKGYQKEGFGKYSPQGFYGRINLIDTEEGKWTLTRNKLAALELGSLLNCKGMQDFIRPILEKLKQQHRTVTLRISQASVEVALNNMLRNVKVSLTEIDDDDRGHKRTTRTRNGISNEPGERPDGPPRPPKKPKKPKEDQNSEIKRRMKRALVLDVKPHTTPKEYGLGYVSVTEGETKITVFFDISNPITEAIYNNSDLLLHHAIALLAYYFTYGEDRPKWIGQLKLWGDLEDTAEDLRKASKVWLFLLKNAVLNPNS